MASLPVESVLLTGGTADGDNLIDLAGLGCLPPGAGSPDLVLADERARWTTERLGSSDQVCFLIFTHNHRKDEPLVTSVSYATPNGEHVTYRP
jgi:hypothetical protein